MTEFLQAADLFADAVQPAQISKSRSVEHNRRRAKIAGSYDKPKEQQEKVEKKQKQVRSLEAPDVKPKGKATVIVPQKEELVLAVASLYSDGLRPFGRILRKRLAERAEVLSEAAGEVDLVQLRKACEESCELVVNSEEGGEWSALLSGREDEFIDVYDKIDIYPEELWHAAELYFQNLPEEDAVLPGGRYACAQTLASRGLEFLCGHTLGQICHFVQIAISQRRVLGYLNGGVTSYSRSHSCTKDQAAESRSSCAQAAGVSDLEVATWVVARRCLKIIMGDALKNQSNQVPLSNIKRIFRSQFEIELSETSLGHSKLSELLQDDRLQDICTVRLLDQGYFVIPMFDSCDSQSDGLESSIFSWADESTTLMTDSDDNEPAADDDSCNTPCLLMPSTPCELEAICGTPSLLMPPTPELWASLPLAVSPFPTGCQSPLRSVPEAQTLDARTEMFSWNQAHDCMDLLHHTDGSFLQGGNGFVVANTFITAARPSLGGAKQRSRSLPKSVGLARMECGMDCALDVCGEIEFDTVATPLPGGPSSPFPCWLHELPMVIGFTEPSTSASAVSLRLADHV